MKTTQHGLTLIVAVILMGGAHRDAAFAQGTEAPASYSTLKEVLDATHPEVVVKGDGEISGVVRDHAKSGDGDPVAGVEVMVSPVYGKWLSSRPLSDRIQSLIETGRYRSARTRTATTDAGGRFSFDDLPGDTRYLLQFPREEHIATFKSRAQRGGVDVGSTVEMILRVPVDAKLPEIPTRVLWQGKRIIEPVAFAYEVANGRSRSKSVRYGRDLRAPDGLSIVSAQYRNLESSRVTLDIGKTKPVGIEFELAPRTVFAGWIRGSHDFSSPDLWLVPAGSVQVGSPEPGVDDGQKTDVSSFTSAFRFEEVAPGAYDLVLVSNDKVARLWGAPVTAGFNFQKFDVGDDAPLLEVRTVFPHLKPQGIKYRFQTIIEGDHPVRSFATAGNASGETTIMMLPHTKHFSRVWSGGERGTIRLHVIAEGVGTEVVDLVPGQRKVTVQFDPPATATIDVPGYLRSDVVGRLRILLTPELEGGEPISGSPNWLGKFPTIVATPGRYTAHISVFGERVGHTVDTRAVDVPVQLKPGESTVTLALP